MTKKLFVLLFISLCIVLRINAYSFTDIVVNPAYDKSCSQTLAGYMVNVTAALIDIGPVFVSITRENAMIFSAAHDAINTIDQQYGFVRGSLRPQALAAGLSSNDIKKANYCAALYAAAYKVLKYTTETRPGPVGGLFYQNKVVNGVIVKTAAQLLADAQASVDNFYTVVINYLKATENDGKVNDGIVIGNLAADAIIAERANDGFNQFIPEVNERGDMNALYSWYSDRLNGENPNALNIYPHWRYVKTFLLSRPKDLPVPPPLAETDPIYLRDLTETRDYGGKLSTLRTEAQANHSAWWGAGSGVQPHLFFAALAKVQHYGDYKVITGLTGISLGQADAMIHNLWWKKNYNFFRPKHALNDAQRLPYGQGIKDIAAGAARNPVNGRWEPNQPTPNNQEYPAGHPSLASAGSLFLKKFLGYDRFPQPITVDYPGSIGGPQTVKSFTAIHESSTNARVWGGMHLRTSCETSIGTSDLISNIAATMLRTVSNYETDED